MDRLSGNDTYYREWYCDLCHATNPCQQESPEEENRGECGDEWRELLYPAADWSGRISPATIRETDFSYGQRGPWCGQATCVCHI